MTTLVFVTSSFAFAAPVALEQAGDNRSEIQGFLDEAAKLYGEFGTRAAEFLVEGMPERDLKTLKQDFLVENLKLAIEARETFAWAKAVPEEIFFNDVLPYASLDETREAWRKDIYPQAKKIVAGCTTTTEAAQALNKQYFNVINVHYNTGRKRPNQSPSESAELGKATCTGLSIILVDACRAVGVPARVAGTALWSNKRGNHTWVEIWDDGQWYFTGADEFDARGLNRGWFVGDASKAVADDWKHAIWATSWRKADAHFPMVWNRRSQQVAAVNVTERYASKPLKKADGVVAYFRVFDGRERLAAELEVIDAAGKSMGSVTTKAGRTDLNDMPQLDLTKNQTYQVTLHHNGQTREATFSTSGKSEITFEWQWSKMQPVSASATSTIEAAESTTSLREWLKLPAEQRASALPQGKLTRHEAEAALAQIYQAMHDEQQAARQEELANNVVKAAGQEMKLLEKVFGDAPDGEKSLWISMHGGGNAPPRVNDQQWNNQIRLYEPEEGIMIAPRAPTNTWNLWHEAHIDALFDRLIENYVLLRGVNPERVYLMGYSAGGDGVYQLAPRMADRFAAASMMAGHPNDASPVGLRNLPFMIFMGGNDGAYKRNEVAAEWGGKLDKLQQNDPQSYEHKLTIYEGLGHWMQGKDVEALPWMAARTRNTWPKKVVWRQSGRTHTRFYWLAVPADQAQGGQVVTAEVNGQNVDIQVEGELNALTLRLNDKLLDLDQPIEVTVNSKQVYSGTAQRTVKAIRESLAERFDPSSVATATVDLKL